VKTSEQTSKPDIPTDDPHAALAFCRDLHRFLQHNQNQTHAPTVQRDPQKTMPDISVVTPVYNEQENISLLHQRLTDVFTKHGKSYEIVFVNDGSKDNSLIMLDDIAEKDDRVVVVDLARNFGHQTAISAGIDFATGKGVIVMDADLQDPPEVLPLFIEKWQQGYDVVYAVRKNRKEFWPKRTAYKLFYQLLRLMTSINIPLDSGDFCIMDRKVVDYLKSMPERNRFIRGIRSWVGFKQTGLCYDRDKRYAGKPKYNFSRLMILALDGFISFSHKPLRFASLLGICISIFSLVLALFYFIKKLTMGLNPPGFATITVAVFFFAGLQLTTLGVIGEYIGRIFDEVKQRPLYIIRQVKGGRFR
jgi:dolichol-phosphate mannosyltransferase